MSDREQELALRREALLARCAVQRYHLAETADQIESQLGGIDRGINVARSIVRSPALIVAGISLLALIGPGRMLRWAGRALVLISSTRRMLGLVRKVRSFSGPHPQ